MESSLSISRPTLRASLLAIGCLAVAVSQARAVMPLPGGDVPSELTQSFDAGLFKLPARHSGLSTSAVQTAWSVPVVLVAFSDQPFSTTLYGGKTPAQHFEKQLFDSSGATTTVRSTTTSSGRPTGGCGWSARSSPP